MTSRSLFKSQRNGYALFSIVLGIMVLTLSVLMVTSTTKSYFKTERIQETMRKIRILEVGIAAYKLTHAGAANPALLSYLVTMPVGDSACAVESIPANPNYRSRWKWCGPYVDYQVFSNTPGDYSQDGWGTTINYNSGTSTLTSYGPNLAAGGGDDITFVHP